MPKINFVVLFLLLQFVWHSRVWSIDVQARVAYIDSLIFNSNYPLAGKEIKNLNECIASDKVGDNKIELTLRIQYLQARMHERQEQIKDALNMLIALLENPDLARFAELDYKTNLLAALVFEKADDFSNCKKYLNRALSIAQSNNLFSEMSTYYIRNSSYFRFVDKIDSAIFYANLAADFAAKYYQLRDQADANLLLGILLKKRDYTKAVDHLRKAIVSFESMNDLEGVSAMYDNISVVFRDVRMFDSALYYNQISLNVLDQFPGRQSKEYIFLHRFQIYDSLGQIDSSYQYFKKYHAEKIEEMNALENAEIKNITEQYENDKKEATIKDQHLWLIFVIIIACLITTIMLVTMFKNRKINKQHFLIQKQVKTLGEMVKHKEILFSELQHRVKNNLQQVISILEIQKESVSYNTIDELIRSNQNRIHSMALLHNTLTTSKELEKLNLHSYFEELVSLVVDSYMAFNKRITTSIKVDIRHIDIDTAIPLGLIIVELLSNSIKHAFVDKVEGMIRIDCFFDKDIMKHALIYTDNGIGYDFTTLPKEGLGTEIIKGLVQQLKGKVIPIQNEGFGIVIYF